MNHRRADVRAAVFQRQRSQGHLRAVTVLAGLAGVVTAGAVAAILPGSTHAAASSATAPRPGFRQRRTGGQRRLQQRGPGQQRPRHQDQGQDRPASPPPPRQGQFRGDREHRPGRSRPGSGADHGAAADRVRRVLTQRP